MRNDARRLVGSGALIPPQRSYRQQLKVYETQTREAGLYRMHGLRHGYTLERYEELTGWKAPAAGDPARRTLTGARRRIDTAARRTIAQEIGHSRLGVVSAVQPRLPGGVARAGRAAGVRGQRAGAQGQERRHGRPGAGDGARPATGGRRGAAAPRLRLAPAVRDRPAGRPVERRRRPSPVPRTGRAGREDELLTALALHEAGATLARHREIAAGQ